MKRQPKAAKKTRPAALAKKKTAKPKAAQKKPAKQKQAGHPAAKAMRAAALAYPQTVEDHPWGDTAFKVAGKKVFCFFGENSDGGFGCSLKLPFRAADALKLKGARPTPYGLGRAGWVSLSFGNSDKPNVAQLLDWLDESWRSIAPKKLSAATPAPKR